MNYLNGMFAFVIWDNIKKIFFARDRIGIKPFYYLKNQTYLFFLLNTNNTKCFSREKVIDKISMLKRQNMVQFINLIQYSKHKMPRTRTFFIC